MIKKFKLPTLLGIIILLAGTFAGVFFLNMTQVFRIGASPENSPKDVRISNLSDSSATISWITDSETEAFINYGTNENSLGTVEAEDSSGLKYKTHQITLSGLSANTQYFFKINSNGSDYDNNSLPWKFTTGPELGFEEFSIPISGTVITATGNPVKRGMVYLNLQGYLISTLSSDSGSYVLQLGDIRTQNLKAFQFIDEETVLKDPLLEISVQTGDGNFGSAQINLLSAESIPPIVTGKSQDFRNSQVNSATDPGAVLNLPNTSGNDSSKFNVQVVGTQAPSSTVILESLKDGEVISTEKPQFFGKGPSGQSIKISIHSDQELTGNINIPKNGSWSWSPPQNLAPGSHKITISWIDTSGITRSLTRNFIVQASEVPSFSASGSGEIATPKPTNAPTLKPTATVTPEQTTTPIETTQPVPVTGELTPTVFLFIMSVGILLFSFGIWKISENA